jgi:hypothetical protein
MVVEEGDADLFQIVFADGDVRRLTGLLDGRHQQPNQYNNDGHHDEHFDEGEPRAIPARTRARRTHGRTSAISPW